MLVGRIRSAQTVKVKVSGESLEEIRDALAAQAPAGFELVKAPVEPRRGETTLDAVGTFAARGEIREIEAEDMPRLRALVPDGWALLSVRS